MLKYCLMVAMLGILGTPLGTKASSVGVQFLMVQNQSQALNTTPLEYFYGNVGGTNANLMAGYAPVAQTNWNTIGGVYGYVSTVSPGTTPLATKLIDKSGALTPVTVSATGFFYGTGAGSGSGDDILAQTELLELSGLAYGTPSPTTITITNIPYSQYTIYVYTACDSGGNYAEVTVGSSNQYFISTNFSSAWVIPPTTSTSPGSPGDVLVFSNLSGSGQQIVLNGNNPTVGYDNVGINGIQIVSSTGQSIGIQLWLDDGSTYRQVVHTPPPVNLKAGVASVAQTNWNSIITDYQGSGFTSTYTNLIDSTGATINSLFATVSGWAWSQATIFDSSDPNQVGDSDLGSGTVLAEGATHAHVGITNIPYSQYNLYVYLCVDNQGNSGQCTIGSTVDNYTTASVGGGYVSTSQWTTITNTGDFADYLVFTNLTGSSQLIDLYVPSNGGINGFQIVQTGIVAPIPLHVSYAAGNVTLTWADPSFSLQSATNVNGPYTTIVGATSGYTEPVSGTQKFYRLIH